MSKPYVQVKLKQTYNNDKKSREQTTQDLDLFTNTLKGIVPGSGGGTTNFLRADGSWAAPPGGGGLPPDGTYADIQVTGLGTSWTLVSPVNTSRLATGTASGTTWLRGDSTWSALPGFTTTDAGTVPPSGGGTTNFLRADGTWTIPANFTSVAPGFTPASGGGTTNFLRADGSWTAPATFTSVTNGFAPASGGGTTNFLRADGTWAAPGGGGTVTRLTLTAPSNSGTEWSSTVSVAGATASSKVSSELVLNSSLDQNGYDELQHMNVWAVPASGQITFTLTHRLGPFTGPFYVDYTLS